jgi:hypothetical protein
VQDIQFFFFFFFLVFKFFKNGGHATFEARRERRRLEHARAKHAAREKHCARPVADEQIAQGRLPVGVDRHARLNTCTAKRKHNCMAGGGETGPSVSGSARKLKKTGEKKKKKQKKKKKKHPSADMRHKITENASRFFFF